MAVSPVAGSTVLRAGLRLRRAFDGAEAMLLRDSSTTSDLMPLGVAITSFFSVTTRLRFLAGGLATSSMSRISCLISRPSC